MDVSALPWPTEDPTYGGVRLRPFDPAYEAADVAMARDLSTDPYIPLIGTLPAHADDAEAAAYISRQRGRLAEGKGFVFAIAPVDDRAACLGFAGFWLREADEGRAVIGYGVAPSARRRGVARDTAGALTAFAWTFPWLHRVEAYVEPWNEGSWRACEGAGLQREGLLRSHQVIGGSRCDMYLYAAIRPTDRDANSQVIAASVSSATIV